MALFAFLGLIRIVGTILGLTLDCGTISIAWAVREAAG